MKTVDIFLASSIVEFKKLRNEIGYYINNLNSALLEHDVYVNLHTCEATPNEIALDRKQEQFNEAIRKSDFMVLLIGKKMGDYTKEEYYTATKANVTVHIFVANDEDAKNTNMVEEFNQNKNNLIVAKEGIISGAIVMETIIEQLKSWCEMELIKKDTQVFINGRYIYSY